MLGCETMIKIVFVVLLLQTVMFAAAENSTNLTFSPDPKLCSLNTSWSIVKLKPDGKVDDVFVCREDFNDSNSRFKAPCPAKDRQNITFQITSPEPSDYGTYCLQEHGKDCSCVPLDFNKNSTSDNDTTDFNKNSTSDNDTTGDPWIWLTGVGVVVVVAVGLIIGICYCIKKQAPCTQRKTRKTREPL